MTDWIIYTLIAIALLTLLALGAAWMLGKAFEQMNGP